MEEFGEPNAMTVTPPTSPCMESRINAHVLPAQCPLNSDGTLSIGTLQSAMPGAGGLYYKVSGEVEKVTLRVDRQNGVIFPPEGGWKTADKYYVNFFQPARHCGHCCMQSSNVTNVYEKATQNFEKQLRAVQKMMADGDDADEDVNYVHDDDEVMQQVVNQTQAMMGDVNKMNTKQMQLQLQLQASKTVENTESLKEIANLKRELEAKNAEVNELKENLNAARSTNESQTSSLHETQIELNSTKDKLRAITEQLDSLSKDQSPTDSPPTDSPPSSPKVSLTSAPSEGEERLISLEGMRRRMNRLAEGKARYKAMAESLKHKLEETKNTAPANGSDNQTMEDLKAKLGDIERELAERKTHITWLENELSNVHTSNNDRAWKIGELESMLNDHSAKLNSADCTIRELMQNNNGGEVNRSSSRSGLDESAIDEMHLELRKSLDVRQTLEKELATATADLQQCQQKLESFGSRVTDLEKDIWCTKEDRSRLDCENSDKANQLDDLRRQLTEVESSNYRRQEHIVSLEQKLNMLETEREHLSERFDGALIIKKKPHVDREKWRLAAWQPTPEIYSRVWFELIYREPVKRQVYLLASFFNWECAVLCEESEKDHYGIWVYVPKGRHEFRFVVDGEWHTAGEYEQTWNDYGTQNNVVNVTE